MIRSLIAAAVLTASFAQVAHADSERQQAAACQSDAFKFCKSEIPDKEKITACMKKHYKALSPACQAEFK